MIGYYSKREVRILPRNQPLKDLTDEFTDPGFLYVGDGSRFPYPDHEEFEGYDFTEPVWSGDGVTVYRIDHQ